MSCSLNEASGEHSLFDLSEVICRDVVPQMMSLTWCAPDVHCAHMPSI
jgi:hypothetical protein